MREPGERRDGPQGKQRTDDQENLRLFGPPVEERATDKHQPTRRGGEPGGQTGRRADGKDECAYLTRRKTEIAAMAK